MLDQLTSRVYVVDDGVCILGCARGENAHLIVFVGRLEKFSALGSNIETDILNNTTVRSCYVDFHHWRTLWIFLLNTMYQCFV